MGKIYGTSYYSIVDGQSWTTAESNAIALGGNLASINDSQENSFILETLGPMIGGSSRGGYWIGLNADLDGNFSWSSGDPYSYNNFSAGQGLITDYRPFLGNNTAVDGQYVHVLGPYLREVGFRGESAGEWNDFPNNPTVDISWGAQYELNKGVAEIPLSYFSITDESFREGKGGNITITRTGGTTTSQTLQVQSSDSSATTADSDYTAINTTISFAAGETSKTINVSTTADLNIEGNETFNLAISAEGSDAVPPQLSDSTATITIQDSSTVSISQSPTSVNEGGNSKTSISTTNVASGTYLYYDIKGNEITQADFSTPLQGSIIINSDGTGELTNTISQDQVTEGNESFNVRIFTDLNRTDLVDTSPTVTISDTSTTPLPTYSIASSPSTINEGGTLTTTVSTTNVASGTILYWAISGSNVNKADFSSGSLSGSCTVDNSGTCSFSHSLVEDKVTEGDESFAFNLFSDDKGNTPLASSSSITIHDTSIAPKPPTYSLSLTPRTIEEGDAFRASINTKNLDAGTRLYYAIKGDIDGSDLTGSKTGSIAVDKSGSASFTRRTIEDLFTEGTESADVFLYTDSQRTLQVAKDSLDISDTSTSPKKAAYSISFEPSSIEEGDQLTTSISTENVDPGTTLHWTFSGDGINAGDFSSGDLSGSANLNRSGAFSLSHSIAQDLSTEGTEELTLQLFSDLEHNNLLNQQKISIADTSKTPQSASLLSASVDSNNLSLNFDGELDDARPSPQRFSITADGNRIPVQKASLNAKAASLILKFKSAIKPDQKVQLTYTDLKGNQTKGVLQTPDGSDLPSFSTAVANIARDNTPPRVTDSYASNKTLTLALSEALDVTTPTNSSWTLKEDGKAIPIASSSVDPLAAQLSLTLAKSLDRGSELSLGYSDLNGDQKTSVIQDLAGNDLPSFSDLSVENRTTRSLSPLNINTAEIDGSEIVLAFDRELDSTAPSKGTFRLTANGKAIKIKSINLNADDREATIILKSAVEHGDEVFLSYTDAKGNQKRNVIQDIDGNDLDSFSSLALSNNTRKQSKDFFVDYADADGSTINLYLTGTLSNSIPNASRFRITANKRRQLISSVSTDPSDGVVTLNLKRPLNTNQDVLIAYRDLNGDQSSGIIEDDDGNDLASFSNLVPINDTTDIDPPILQDAYLDSKELILEFDELLSPGTIKNSRFKVRADKKRIRVTSADIPIDDSIAILELKSTIPPSTKELSLTYRDLKGDQSAGIIQDIDGNDLKTLRNFPIEII